MYNELNPTAAAWLNNLVSRGLVAPGEVLHKSIEEVTPNECPRQSHFFAGIGLWSYALRLAGVPDDAPVWTGSCPCQPFSIAGKRAGERDERHLWPVWRELIAECLPPVVFGEQTASPAGRDWLSVVRAEMEALGYEVGCADLCAAGAGAPHLRQRLYWGARMVEHPDCYGGWRNGRELPAEEGAAREDPQDWKEPDCAESRGSVGGVANPNSQRLEGRAVLFNDSSGQHPGERSVACIMANDNCIGREGESETRVYVLEPGHNADGCRLFGFLDDAEWAYCRDNKFRPVERGSFPLADGDTSRVGRIRAYGNAIVPQLAAHFVKAFLEA